jgi:uncharacterized membrane protein
MSESGPTSLPKARLEAISDGVFSVVMTLLVLDLRQDFTKAIAENNHQFGHAFAAMHRALVPYAITFVLAGMFWLHQSRMMHLVARTTSRHAWLTLIFLFWVTLLPLSFTTVSLNFTGLEIYLGNMTLIASFLVLSGIDARYSGLIPIEQMPKYRVLSIRLGALAVGCALSTVASIFAPDYGWMVLLAVSLPGRFFAGKLAGVASEASPQPETETAVH